MLGTTHLKLMMNPEDSEFMRVIKDDAEENRLFTVCFTLSQTPLIEHDLYAIYRRYNLYVCI